MSAETLADILAEMRNRADTIIEGRVITARNFVTQEAVEAWADRIEAAAQREREAAEARQLNECVVVREEEASEWRKRTGNAAAMRAALEGIVRIAEEWDTPGIHAVQATLYRILEAARAALAAPPRNCDSYDVENGVTACMQAIDAAWHEIDTIRATIDWLLAPAEGGEE